MTRLRSARSARDSSSSSATGMAASQPVISAAVQGCEIRLDGTKIATLNDNLVLVRLSAAHASANSPAKLETRERASTLVLKAVKALAKPGIRRETVFGHGSGRGIYAYSVYPADTTKIVRESADGQTVLGRMVGGRFRVDSVKSASKLASKP